MDPAPAIGIGGEFAVVIASNVMEGGNPMSLLLPAPLTLGEVHRASLESVREASAESDEPSHSYTDQAA